MLFYQEKCKKHSFTSLVKLKTDNISTQNNDYYR